MRIFLSAGEPSGDLHAANLIRAIRQRDPSTECVGFGGPRMARAGAEVLVQLVDLAVMWFGRVLLHFPKFLRAIWLADRYFLRERPDAVVLIDYPGLHWWLARRAKARGIPVFYYVPPQLWAWAGWRVAKVRKFVDHVLCSLPFEPEWYHARGVERAEYVGHPYFDELTTRKLDDSFLAEQRAKGGSVVTLLPGSRTQELTKNLPTLLKAAQRLAASHPDVRFVVAGLNESHVVRIQEMIGSAGVRLPIEVYGGRTPELIRLADVAWAVSGSVGLELMMEAVPTVVLYKIRSWELWLARWFIRAPYISLVNLLAQAEVMPEYLTGEDVSGELAAWAAAWLDHPGERAEESARLAEVRDRVVLKGASERAAERILEHLAAARRPRSSSWGWQRPHHVATAMPGTSRADRS
jgi:lipid-A-disaccharide synthase